MVLSLVLSLRAGLSRKRATWKRATWCLIRSGVNTVPKGEEGYLVLRRVRSEAVQSEAVRGRPVLSATITEKVDVYSFGIVVLEILCSRKNVDRSQPEEEMHLLRHFTKKAREGKLLELVDKFSEDMQSNGEEVVKMMRMAAWCLQADYNRRPSMWAVVKVLEGDLNFEDNLSYDFLNMQAGRAIATPSSRAGTTSIPLPLNIIRS
ncbi:hypothetical protein PTKIN_Ptkin07bG0022400 [Pterospermum kingtungense]